MTKIPMLRYFLVLRLHPPYALAILLSVAALAVWTIAMSPAELDAGLAMVLFVHMFLSSSGFVGRAERGHFDSVLLAGRDRSAAATWHWVASILPGVAAWTVLAGFGAVAGSPAAASAFAGRRVAALFIVSALAWSAGFHLQRGAAGVLWIGALLAVLVRRIDLLAVDPGAVLSSTAAIRHAAVVLVCPFLLVGGRAAVGAESVWAATAFAAAVLLWVWRSAAALDLRLRDEA